MPAACVNVYFVHVCASYLPTRGVQEMCQGRLGPSCRLGSGRHKVRINITPYYSGSAMTSTNDRCTSVFQSLSPEVFAAATTYPVVLHRRNVCPARAGQAAFRGDYKAPTPSRPAICINCHRAPCKSCLSFLAAGTSKTVMLWRDAQGAFLPWHALKKSTSPTSRHHSIG